MTNTKDVADLRPNYCDAVYQQGLFLIEFIVEGIFLFILILLTLSIWRYVKSKLRKDKN